MPLPVLFEHSAFGTCRAEPRGQKCDRCDCNLSGPLLPSSKCCTNQLPSKAWRRNPRGGAALAHCGAAPCRVRDWTAGGGRLATLSRKIRPAGPLAGSGRRNARRTWMDPPEGASRWSSARRNLPPSIQTNPIPPETPLAVVRAPGQPRPAQGCVVARGCRGVLARTGMERRPRRRSGPCRSALAVRVHRAHESLSTVTVAPISTGCIVSSGASNPRALQVGRS